MPDSAYGVDRLGRVRGEDLNRIAHGVVLAVRAVALPSRPWVQPSVAKAVCARGDDDYMHVTNHKNGALCHRGENEWRGSLTTLGSPAALT